MAGKAKAIGGLFGYASRLSEGMGNAAKTALINDKGKGLGRVPLIGAAQEGGRNILTQAVMGASTVHSAAKAISAIPWYVAIPGAAALGVAANAMGPRAQGTPTGPATGMPMPGYFNNSSALGNLGASGDLVFALHNLNH